jgi:hypothetical protein
MKTILLFSLIILNGCAASLPQPSVHDLEYFRSLDSTITIESIREARTLYIGKCSGCHGLYLPEAFNTKEWANIVNKMSVKSKSTPLENEKILTYLSLYSLKNSVRSKDSLSNKIGMELETK